MSHELSREQVLRLTQQLREYSKGTMALSAVIEQIEAHDAALRAQLAAQGTAKMEFAEAVESLRIERTTLQRQLAEVMREREFFAAHIKSLHWNATDNRTRSLGPHDPGPNPLHGTDWTKKMCRMLTEWHQASLTTKLEAIDAAIVHPLNDELIMVRQQLDAMMIERNDLDDTRQGLEAELSHAKEQLAAMTTERDKAIIVYTQQTDTAERQRNRAIAHLECVRQQLAEAQATIGQLRQILTNMPQQGKPDEDIPDDKEAAYRTGYSDAIIDCNQALASGEKETT